MIHIKTTIRSAYPLHDPRNAALRGHLDNARYTIRAHKRGWQAESHDGEGNDHKDALRAAGFADYDYHLYDEYQRAWGYL